MQVANYTVFLWQLVTTYTPTYSHSALALIILKKSVESTTYYSTTGGAYCTESKVFFTLLKFTHRVTWVASRKWIASKKQKFALYSVH